MRPTPALIALTLSIAGGNGCSDPTSSSTADSALRAQVQVVSASAPTRFNIASDDSASGYTLYRGNPSLWGNLRTGGYVEYDMDVLAAGTYSVQLYYSTTLPGQSADIEVNGSTLALASLPSTGSWEAFVESSAVSVKLQAGDGTLRLAAVGTNPAFNLEGLLLTPVSPSAPTSPSQPTGPTAPVTPPVSPPPSGRNVLLQPFASDSIWNMPIGSDAVYAAADITPPSNVAADEDILILTPTAPLTSLDTNAAAWQGGVDRCNQSTYPNKSTGLSLPIPTDFVLSNTSPGQTGTPNNSGAILAADGQTIYSPQPVQRCVAGGPLTYLTNVLYPNTNLYTDGIAGAHGGSGLSSIGGTIRMGELVPGSSTVVNGVANPIRHVLKFEFNTGIFTKFASNFVWPATQGGGGGEGSGLLVALLPSFDFNSLLTAPGRSIAWTLINYGAYLVDSTGWDALQICTELSTTTNAGTTNREEVEFQSDWGYAFNQSGTSTDWGKDIATIMKSLQVVTNNGPTSIGGGGTPRQPLLPSVTAP
jgi:Carbohydrate binding module (family 6)